MFAPTLLCVASFALLKQWLYFCTKPLSHRISGILCFPDGFTLHWFRWLIWLNNMYCICCSFLSSVVSQLSLCENLVTLLLPSYWFYSLTLLLCVFRLLQSCRSPLWWHQEHRPVHPGVNLLLRTLTQTTADSQPTNSSPTLTTSWAKWWMPDTCPSERGEAALLFGVRWILRMWFYMCDSMYAVLIRLA